MYRGHDHGKTRGKPPKEREQVQGLEAGIKGLAFLRNCKKAECCLEAWEAGLGEVERDKV